MVSNTKVGVKNDVAFDLPDAQVSIESSLVSPHTITVTTDANVIWTNDTGESISPVGG